MFSGAFARMILPGLFLLTGPSGCLIPHVRPSASVTGDHAFITYQPAEKNDKKLRLAVKDSIDMKGEKTTVGSEFLAVFGKPATDDAKCLATARKRGDVEFVGKTNLSELAVATSGVNAYFGTPRNPLRHSLIPGGSSSGSAVAVANGEADVALGTDSAGSIRVPAACCGIVGLKTTYGLIPLDGVYPIAPTQLDTVGPMARNVADTVQGMDLLQPGFAAQYRQAVANKPLARGIRIGRLYIDGTDPKVDRAVDDALTKTGFKVERLSSKFTENWMQAQTDAATVAAVGAWLHDQQVLIEPQVSFRTKTIVALGGVEYTSTYGPALGRKSAWKAAIDKEFEKVDFIALPTMQKLPPHVPLFSSGTVAFEASMLAWQNTQAVNFAGVPALAIPVPIPRASIPVTSLQLIGPSRSEAPLLNAARLIEDAVKSR